MVQMRPKSFACFFLVLWVFLTLILYILINWRNVVFCIKVYQILLLYPKTILLLIAPSLIVSLIALIRLVASRLLRRAKVAP